MKVLVRNYLPVILLLILSETGLGQYTKWEKDTTFQGIEFEKIRFREDGRESLYAKGILKQKTIIEDYPCHKKVTLNKDGKLIFFVLAEDSEVAGNEFKKETHVVIRTDDTFLIHCLYEPTVQGYQIKRTPYRSPFFVGSTNFQLYKSGKLLYFQPTDDVKIDEVWCRPSPARGGVHLFENGKLQACTSAKKQVIQGTKVEKNFELKFDKNGKLIFAEELNFFGNIKN
jgi:hypothetical protein